MGTVTKGFDARLVNIPFKIRKVQFTNTSVFGDGRISTHADPTSSGEHGSPKW